MYGGYIGIINRKGHGSCYLGYRVEGFKGLDFFV